MDADDLYRLPPEDFTAARDAAVEERRAAGDKEGAAQLKALRRPSVAAWLVDLLAHEEHELLEQLLSLGPALAQAQARGQGDELRELGAQRRRLVDAVADRAVELSGRAVAAAVREEVRSTLEAALADADSADAVRSGRLVRSLSYAGFGGVDLDGAVAVLRGAPRAGRRWSEEVVDDRATQVAEAEAAALDAAGALDDAVRACERAEQARGAAEQQAEQARQELARRQEAVRQAERAVREAEAARRTAEEGSERAVRLVERRQAAEQEARSALDRLRRGTA